MSTQESSRDAQRRVEQDRAELDRTIDAIQDRFSPGQLLDQAMGYVRSGGSEVAATIGRSASRNPWPLVLTGVGLAWLMASSARADPYDRRYGDDEDEWDYGLHRNAGETEASYRARVAAARTRTYGSDPAEEAALHEAHERALERANLATRDLQRTPDEAEEAYLDRVAAARARAFDIQRDTSETSESFRDRVEQRYRDAQRRAADMRRSASRAVHDGAEAVRSGADSLRRRGSDLGRRAGEAASSARDEVGRQADAMRERGVAARDRAGAYYDAQPLVVGALGVLAGAVIGAQIPTSRAEDRLFGEYGEQAREQASGMARDAMHRAEEVATEATHAAADAAEQAARRQAPESSGSTGGGTTGMGAAGTSTATDKPPAGQPGRTATHP